jgi:hypothetical protein
LSRPSSVTTIRSQSDRFLTTCLGQPLGLRRCGTRPEFAWSGGRSLLVVNRTREVGRLPVQETVSDLPVKHPPRGGPPSGKPFGVFEAKIVYVDGMPEGADVAPACSRGMLGLTADSSFAGIGRGPRTVFQHLRGPPLLNTCTFAQTTLHTALAAKPTCTRSATIHFSKW